MRKWRKWPNQQPLWWGKKLIMACEPNRQTILLHSYGGQKFFYRNGASGDLEAAHAQTCVHNKPVGEEIRLQGSLSKIEVSRIHPDQSLLKRNDSSYETMRTHCSVSRGAVSGPKTAWHVYWSQNKDVRCQLHQITDILRRSCLYYLHGNGRVTWKVMRSVSLPI